MKDLPAAKYHTPAILHNKNPVGIRCPVEVNSKIVTLNRQKLIISIVRDITEQKQNRLEKINAQQHAAEQEKLALVGQVAGKMAHDFNNILSIIMGDAELSLMECRDESTKKPLT